MEKTTTSQITLQFSIKNVYGIERLYPANEKAGLCCNLIKKTTVDNRDLHLLKSLGFAVEVIAVTLPAWVAEALQ